MPFVHLTDRAVLAVDGADAASFLNGLLTSDVAALAPGQACYAGLLSPQGKALFDLFALRCEAGFLIDVAATRSAALLAKLNVYRLRAAVTLAARSDLAVRAGWGAAAMPGGSWPDPRLDAMGWRAIGPSAVTQEPVEGSGEATLSDYHSHRISLAVPDTPDIGTDQLLWLEANGNQLHGVSFTKGCYVGQENTARMQHRGKVRKQIFRVTSTEGLPPRGTPVISGEKEAGHLLGVMGDQGLALLRLEYIERGDALTAAGEPVRVDVADYLPV